MVRYLQRAPAEARRLGIFPAAFNPVTAAHLALADAAAELARLDATVLALPEELPHKTIDDASLEDRLAMLQAAAATNPRLPIATCRGGLVYEIAREFREAAGPSTELFVICGRDAAERFARWDYGSGPSFEQQLGDFQLIVGSREGIFAPPAALRDRILPVHLDPRWDVVSSTAVRAKIAASELWEELVTAPVAEIIRRRRLYGVG